MARLRHRQFGSVHEVNQAMAAQWQASGLSQRAYAVGQGFTVRQAGYSVRRLTGAHATPALLPVRVAPAAAPVAANSLRSERGCTLTLHGDVAASWLAELMRAL